MKKQLLALSLAGLLAAPALVFAQSNTGLANVSAPWLQMPDNPRSAAMAGAAVAMAGDVNGIQSNPAGLSGLKGQQASFMHNAWFQGIADEHVAYGAGLPGTGAGLGASFDYVNFGSVDRYVLNSSGGISPAGSFDPSAYHLDLAYAQDFGQLAAGLSVKMLGQNLDTDRSNGFGADLGGQWRTSLDGLSFGAALQNLGSQLDGSNLPLNWSLGTAWATPAGPGNRLTLAAEADLPAADLGSSSFGLGGEFWLHDLLAARLGYKFADTGTLTGLTGLTAGLGLKAGFAEVDYALVTEGDLGDSSLFSLLVSF